MSAFKEEKNSLSLFKVVALSSIGSSLEMYDFVTYIFFAPYIAKQFFPTTNYLASLLLTFSVFAVGSLCRIIGAIIFGHVGDTKGRKKTLIYTVVSMAVPTIVLTFLPTYQEIGLIAPILLTLMRCLQGLAVGGEFSGSLTFVAEYAPSANRGLICSLIILSLNAGILLSSLIGLIVTKFLVEKGMLWGWRIAFFIGCMLAVLIAMMRRYLVETPLFQKLREEKKIIQAPVLKLFAEEGKKAIFVIGSTIGPALVVGMIMFLPSYLQIFSSMKQPLASFINNSLFLLVLCLSLPFFGKLSDQLGRKPIFISGLLGIIVYIYPFSLWLPQTATFISCFWPLCILALLVSMVLSVFGSFLAENFSTRFRTSGIGIAYNLPFSIITGTFPMISLAIYRYTHSLNFQYAYIIVLAIISIAFVSLIQEKRGKSLPH